MDATDVRHHLYFAYGSNLDPEQMEFRCPGAIPAGIGRLDGWRLRIGERGVATVTESPAAVVWGGLWEVSDEHLRALDRAEGVAAGLYRREVVGIARGDDALDAVVYIEAFTTDGPPRPGYLERILRGAEWFALPADYRAALAGLAR